MSQKSRKLGPPCDLSELAKRPDGLLTTGDMARLSGSTLRTVRFYEETGLLCPMQRTDGGHRLFPRSELKKLQLVGELREAGLSLDEIREMLQVKSRGPCGASASRDLLGRLEGYVTCMRKRAEVLGRLADELDRTRQIIASCQGCKRADLFPAECNVCEVVSEQKSIPKAASVLWSVEER